MLAKFAKSVPFEKFLASLSMIDGNEIGCEIGWGNVDLRWLGVWQYGGVSAFVPARSDASKSRVRLEGNSLACGYKVQRYYTADETMTNCTFLYRLRN